jgi:hypothetical protein
MSKPTDFSNDLAVVSESVNTDVDAIIKLVRQKDAREGDSPSLPNQSDQTANPGLADETHVTQPKPNRHRLSRIRTIGAPSLEQQVILENVTTRLRRETNERLTEVALYQKLKKEDPATRQDIIEAALQEWFQRHGYASSYGTRE